MDDGISFDADGLAHVGRDASWGAETSREVLRALGEVERRSMAANLMSFLMATSGAWFLPNAQAFVLPLAGRMAMLLVARAAFVNLRRQLNAGRDHRGALAWLTAALVLAGASCAPVLAPVLIEPANHAASQMVVGGSVLIGVSLALSLLAPLRRLTAAYAGGFVATFAVLMVAALGWRGIVAVLALCGLLSIVLLYAVATSLHQRRAAENLVENRRLSEELSASLAHAEFLAYRDPLTGLLNRRAFFQSAEGRDDGKRRHLLTIDLDHFKEINDRFGHAMGDRVLVEVGQALRAVTDQLDGGEHSTVRLGGEEFVVVLDIEDVALAAQAAEMFRHAISLVARDIGAPGLVSTASIGLAAWLPGQSLDEVLGRADIALYRAKARGRDRVMRAAA